MSPEHKVQLKLMGMSIARLLIWTNLDNNNIRIALMMRLTERHHCHHHIRLIVSGHFAQNNKCQSQVGADGFSGDHQTHRPSLDVSGRV